MEQTTINSLVTVGAKKNPLLTTPIQLLPGALLNQLSPAFQLESIRITPSENQEVVAKN